jgi:thiol peroxidase
MHLEDMPLDIGYASERVLLCDINAKESFVGGHTGKTQLIITTPLIDTAFINEMRKISETLPTSEEHEIVVSVVVANDSHQAIEIEGFSFLIDFKEELADMYGVRLKGKPFDGELTKALILISKDGAIYYDEFCDDLSQAFNIDTLYRKILAAQLCYTGKGCHE